MKKQYCLEWGLMSGHYGWKSIGEECPEEAVRQMKRKIRNKSCISAWVNWNWCGEDTPDEEMGRDYFYKGLYKYSLEVFGTKVYIQNDIREMKGDEE